VSAKKRASVQPLSGLDAAFVYLEAAGTPMHVGGLMLLDRPKVGRAGFTAHLRAHLAQRLPKAKALRRILQPAPFAMDHPHWVDATDFDLDQHLSTHHLPKPGSEAQLLAVVARLHAKPLDRSRPLWELHVIEGLADGSVAVFALLHHALLDGQGAVALARVLLDIAPGVPIPAHTAHPRPVPSVPRKASAYARVSSALLGLPQSLRDAWSAAPQMIESLRDSVMLAPRTPFNVQVGPARRVAIGSVPFADVRRIAKHFAVSTNDVVMALCGAALRDYLLRRKALPRTSLVAAMPISLRANGDSEANNQVSMAQCALRTEIADPVERLQAIAQSTRRIKQQVGLLRGLIPTDFPGLAAPLWASGLSRVWASGHLAEKLPALANLVISNVPGSPVPLYLAGARMRASFPISIVTHGLALNITVQSYAGQLDIGIVSDRDAVRNPAIVLHGIEHAVQVLLGKIDP
jgi:WS/DGAT/MGAT family acyltransferase